ncbi:sigma-70 family RNA polymerase sigma factor [Paraburkholderia sp. SUR17]|uniref:sigma-70 family RNA polymerase sigma factor n=1 Tax=Paraburkholderia sp. SUR17 TaxID=3034358 RepID=UPI0024085B16|nr:sigma-70 family RNA polymerase sigma factor [Paraburkholderia sp. SUR17]WEY37688.1 sigma-70 family RNA polymerase sigma factor [Paraburkholderia sp. SUR17]
MHNAPVLEGLEALLAREAAHSTPSCADAAGSDGRRRAHHTAMRRVYRADTLADPDYVDHLLLGTAQGSESHFAQLYRVTARRLYSVIVRIIHDEADAEDVLQEAFTTTWRLASSFDPARGNAMSWLVSLARNKAIDHVRRYKYCPLDDPVAEAIPCDGPSPLALAELSEARAQIENGLRQLEAHHRGALKAAFFGGLTYRELALSLGVPEGTAKSWIRRGLVKLKVLLDP